MYTNNEESRVGKIIIQAFMPNEVSNTTSFRATVIFHNEEQLDAFCAKFPKSLRIKKTALSTGSFENPTLYPMADFWVSFVPDRNKGDKNETGLKRLKRFLALVDDETIEYRAYAKNSAPDLQTFVEFVSN